MATVVASHHSGIWEERREPSYPMNNMHHSNMIPQYDTSRSATSAPVSRGYEQPTSSHMDMGMPLYSANGLATTVPYQSGAFAYDPTSVNPYNMQQPSYYAPNIPHPVSYAPSADIQQLPTVRDGRNLFNPMVKSESTSPLQTNPMYNNNTSYPAECKRSNSEPTEGTATNFATDVDTLMRAIQAKQTTTPEVPEPPKVRDSAEHNAHPQSNFEAGRGSEDFSEASKALPVHHPQL